MRFSQLAPHGLWLPLVFLAACTIFPWLGNLALDGIWLWAVSIVFFGALAMAPGRPSFLETGTAAAMTTAVAVLAPVLADGVAIAMHVPASMRALMVIAAAAPIAQSIGALTAILKLPERGATIAALLTALGAPAVLPLVSHLLAQDALPVSVSVLSHRAVWLVLAPAVLAFLVRWAAPAQVAAWRSDFRGLTVLALSMFAAARGPVLLHCLGEPLLALNLMLLACLVTVCAMFAGWIAAVPFGWEVGLAGMFAAGARNVPIAWAAVAPELDAGGTAFMTLSVVPFYVLPVVMRKIVQWSRLPTLAAKAAT